MFVKRLVSFWISINNTILLSHRGKLPSCCWMHLFCFYIDIECFRFEQYCVSINTSSLPMTHIVEMEKEPILLLFSHSPLFNIYECVPMTESMTKLNAANPPQPMALACGPALACMAAPVTQPLTTAFHTSCFPRYFSTKHSVPPKTPVIKANCRHQYRDLSAVARIVVRTCSFNGAWGTSFPSMMVTGGVMSVSAPMNTPINNPITPPPMTPMAALLPQDSENQSKLGGKSAGVACCRVHGWG